MRWWPAAALAALAAPVGWAVTDHLERDDDFCNACHLAPDEPLHAAVRAGFDARPPATLAGAHGEAGRDGEPFRCIDCHGGASWVGRARVKTLAAKDAFWYVVGHFEEPDGMRWPLWDEDCAKCHDAFEERATDAWSSPRFHEVALHNVDLGVDCVECHQAHEEGGRSEGHFLRPAHVRTQCARCHPELADERAESAREFE
jgi:hypothetical protein